MTRYAMFPERIWPTSYYEEHSTRTDSTNHNYFQSLVLHWADTLRTVLDPAGLHTNWIVSQPAFWSGLNGPNGQGGCFTVRHMVAAVADGPEWLFAFQGYTNGDVALQYGYGLNTPATIDDYFASPDGGNADSGFFGLHFAPDGGNDTQGGAGNSGYTMHFDDAVNLEYSGHAELYVSQDPGAVAQIEGMSSGATGTVEGFQINGGGPDGWVELSGVTGDFISNEDLWEVGGGDTGANVSNPKWFTPEGSGNLERLGAADNPYDALADFMPDPTLAILGRAISMNYHTASSQNYPCIIADDAEPFIAIYWTTSCASQPVSALVSGFIMEPEETSGTPWIDESGFYSWLGSAGSYYTTPGVTSQQVLNARYVLFDHIANPHAEAWFSVSAFNAFNDLSSPRASDNKFPFLDILTYNNQEARGIIKNTIMREEGPYREQINRLYTGTVYPFLKFHQTYVGPYIDVIAPCPPLPWAEYTRPCTTG